MLPDLKTAPIKGKNVLLRIDTDVSIESRWTDGNTGQITDDSRLKASIRTIKFLLESGAAKVYVIGHRGRPKGLDLTYSLWPVANRLAELLGFKREFSKPQQIYEIDKKMVVFENLRFNPGEEDNSPEFAQELAQGRDIFIQDAFASCHRAHASTVGVLKHLQSYVGFSVLREVENLSRLLGATDLTIIIGGKKAKDKLSVIKHLFPRVESVLVGGVVANTFLKRQGHELGRSLIEEETFSQADEILAINQKERKLYLPVDRLLSKSLEVPTMVQVADLDSLADARLKDFYIVDLGPATIRRYQELIAKAKIIFWNGNMGVSEVPEFSDGTREIAEAIILSKAKKYAGGGDTTAFLRENHLDGDFDFLSSGGGATLEFLAGKKLPGLR